jgi:hypothetical protein
LDVDHFNNGFDLEEIQEILNVYYHELQRDFNKIINDLNQNECFYVLNRYKELQEEKDKFLKFKE